MKLRNEDQLIKEVIELVKRFEGISIETRATILEKVARRIGAINALDMLRKFRDFLAAGAYIVEELSEKIERGELPVVVFPYARIRGYAELINFVVEKAPPKTRYVVDYRMRNVINVNTLFKMQPLYVVR